MNIPSKSRLKKCEKGLHEYKESPFKKVREGVYYTEWACMHCGTFMSKNESKNS